ncbi:MAG: response regulator transcription factor [Gammaproteobacteria bacterium]
MQTRTPKPTVFVVDDDEVFLRALLMALRWADYEVEPFTSAHTFLQHFDGERPGCLLLDVRMPGIDGLELQRLLVTRGITTPIIFLTGHGDVRMSVRALKNGAVDFLEKPFSNQRLLESLEQALARDACTRRIEGDRSKVVKRFEHLTPREQVVMALVVSDMSAKEIAAGLRISPRTVEHHREHVMAKMEAASLHDLIIMAVICGVHELRI